MFIVNHYWNVREQNISDVGIVPEVMISHMTLEKGLAEVAERIIN